MNKQLKHALIFINLIFILTGCEEKINQPKDAQILSRSVAPETQVTNAWSTPTTLAEWTTNSPFRSGFFGLTPDAGAGFIASWADTSGLAQFAKHTSSGMPWEPTGPDLSGFSTTFPPRLYTDAQSSVVFATWYSPDQGLNTNFISRYTPDAGWTTPHAFSDTSSFSKVIVGTNDDAVLLWESYAENGTVELNARYFDPQGNLSLINTYIFGQPGRKTQNLGSMTGWITPSGDVEIYWLAGTLDFPGNGSPQSSVQLWKSTYSLSGTGANNWSEPQALANGSFQLNGFLEKISVIPYANGDLLLILESALVMEGSPIMMLEYKAGVWGSLTPVIPTQQSDAITSRVSYNSQGQVTLAWVEFLWSGMSPDVSTVETQIFSMQYHNETGWTAPLQINNSTPLNVSGISFGTGDEPKVSINSTGHIAVTWIDPAEDASNIYANHFDPVTGWQGEEFAVSRTASKDSLLDYKIALANNGDSAILWQETEPATDGNTLVRLQAINHVGAGNGVVNVKTPLKTESNPSFANRYGIRTSRTSLTRTITTPMTPQQRLDRLLSAKNPNPIRINSAWDEPVVIDTITVPANEGKFMDTLHFTSNELGEVLVRFLIDPSNPTSHVWAGNVLSGGWRRDIPDLLVGSNSSFLNDLVVDPLTNDFYLGWVTVCPDNTCAEIYVARKPSSGNWEAPVLLSSNSADGIDLLVNSKGIGATWFSSKDIINNPEIAYAEYQQDTGWSAPDLFSPTINPGIVSVLSHKGLRALTSVLGESGVVSMVADVSDSQANNIAILVQRHPINGWQQSNFPVQTQALSMGTVYLSATGADDAVHAIVSEGFSSMEKRELSFQYNNGNWGPQQDVTAPKKGDIMSGGFDVVPKDSNTKGQILVAWSEQVVNNFQVTRQVRVNWFDPALGWGQPTDIGFAIPGTFSFTPGSPFFDLVEFMRVSINESGQGAVAWIDNTGPQQALNIVHLDPSMSTTNHEIVMTLDPAIAMFDALDLHVDNQGRAILVWDEKSAGSTEDTHVIKTTTHHQNGTISPQPIIPPEIPSPDIPQAPKQSAGWSDAEIAWEFSTQADWRDLPRQAEIAVLSASPMLSIQVDRLFDPANNVFTSSDRAIVSSPAVGAWNEQNPYGTVIPDVMTDVQLASDSNSQTMYALWTAQGGLYINAQKANSAWGQPQLISNDTDKAYLLSNDQGQAVVVWQTNTDVNTIFVSELSVDATGVINITVGNPSTNSSTSYVSAPVLSDQGTVALLRVVSTANGPEYIVTQYDIGNGWRTWPDQTLNMTGFVASSLQLAMTSSNQLVVFAQSETLRTLHSAFLQVDNSWSNWINIQNSNGLPVTLIGQYRVGTSSAGHLHVMWVEEVIDVNGEPSTNVLFSSLNSAGILTGEPWQAPMLITQIRHPNFNETPILLVSRDGAAAIVWQHPLAPLALEGEGILVKKYRPDTGWAPEAEIAAAFGIFSVGPLRINAKISDTGGLFVVWETIGESFYKVPSTISMTRGQL